MREIRVKPLSRQIDLNLLDLFDAVFRIRSLTDAGHALGLSQPAMSHALARLREAYGDPLFVRSRQGLQPTPFAEQLAGPVATALQIVRSTLTKTTFDPLTTPRTFRIGMSDVGEQFLLPRLVKVLEVNAPGIKIETSDKNPNTLVEGLATGDVDLAIGFFSGAGTGIYQKVLFSDDYVCVVRQAHPVVNSATMSLATFKKLGHILADLPGAAHTGSVIKVLNSREVDANIVLRVNHFLSVAPLISNTNLVATIPRNLANTFVKSWNLRIVEPPIEFPHFDVTQYWHERYAQEPGNVWLRQIFESICGGFDSRDLGNTLN